MHNKCIYVHMFVLFIIPYCLVLGRRGVRSPWCNGCGLRLEIGAGVTNLIPSVSPKDTNFFRDL